MAITSWQVRRQINAAGTFAVRFPVAEPQSIYIQKNWHISLYEEDPTVMAGTSIVGEEVPILYRAVIDSHRYLIGEDGTALLEISGLTRLGEWANYSTHLNLSFTNQTISTIAAALQPTNHVSWESIQLFNGAADVFNKLTIAFNNQPNLEALFKAAEFARAIVRESEIYKAIDIVAMDDIPRPDNAPTQGFTLINLEHAGPELEGIAAAKMGGFGLIAGAPIVHYEGKDIFNRLIIVGADWDGKELTLQSAAYNNSLYAVRTGTNPDATSYYYIQDDASVAKYGLIEKHLVRSDIKNPSNDATTLAQAKAVLLAVGNQTLLNSRSEILSGSFTIANGRDLATLAGDRVRLRYRGRAETLDGSFIWLDVDQHMLVTAITQTGDPSGADLYAYELAAPTVAFQIPALPTAIPIPPPPVKSRIPPQPPRPPSRPPGQPPAKPPGRPPPPTPGHGDPFTPGAIKDLTQNNGAYQACCADPTTNANNLHDHANNATGDIGPRTEATNTCVIDGAQIWDVPGYAGDVLCVHMAPVEGSLFDGGYMLYYGTTWVINPGVFPNHDINDHTLPPGDQFEGPVMFVGHLPDGTGDTNWLYFRCLGGIAAGTTGTLQPQAFVNGGASSDQQFICSNGPLAYHDYIGATVASSALLRAVLI